MDLQNYLRVGQAAKLLGVTNQTVRNWDRAGKLVGVRHPINGYRLYRRADLETLVGSVKQSYEIVVGCTSQPDRAPVLTEKGLANSARAKQPLSSPVRSIHPN